MSTKDRYASFATPRSLAAFGGALVAMAALSLTTPGCSTEGASPRTIPTSRGTNGSLSIGLKDMPIDAKNVWVTLREVNVRSCDGDGWTAVPTQGGTFDLLTLRDGAIGSLADHVALPSGRYCELRLIVDNPAQMVLDSGEQVDVKVSSGSSSGVKIKGEFLIVPGLNSQVIVDFDADASIHETGNGRYQMNPVLRMDRVTYEGTTGKSIEGAALVDFASFDISPDTEGVVSLPGGATLAFEKGSVAAPQEFTVTVWAPRLSSALSDMYVFSPSFTFQKKPVFSLPVKSGGVNPTVYWDYQDLSTQWAPLSPDTSLATAEVPHFSCGTAASRFVGLPNGEWYSNAVVDLQWRGVFDYHDFGDDYFDPAQGNQALPMKRGEIVALLVRAAYDVANEDLTPPDTPPFTDVPLDNPFVRYIDFAKNKKIISGEGGGSTFGVDKSLNRAEMAALVTRVLADKGDAAAGNKFMQYSASAAPNEFSDVPHDWYYPYVYVARDKGIMTGDGLGGTFRPADPVNRVEAAMILCDLAYTKEGCGVCKTKKYSPDAAVGYAEVNVCVDYGNAPNNEFQDFRQLNPKWSNCANFTSQALLAGLIGPKSPDDLKYGWHGETYAGEFACDDLGNFYPAAGTFGSDWRSKVFDDRKTFGDQSSDVRWYWGSWCNGDASCNGDSNGGFGEAFFKVDQRNVWFNDGQDLIRYVTKDHASGLQFASVAKISPCGTQSCDWGDDYKTVRPGDIAFMDWEGDGSFDHVGIVSSLGDTDDLGTKIKFTYQDNDRLNITIDRIWATPGAEKTVFDIYRPLVYRLP